MAQDLGEAVLKLSTDTSAMKTGLTEAQNLLEDFLTLAAVKEIIALGTEMLNAFAQAQRGFITMQVTAGESADALHRWAGEMQKVTEFSDDQIEAQVPLLAGMGMTKDRIEEVMTAAMNLSSVYHVSLDQAVRGLAMSLETGSVGMLGRYIPTLKTFTEEQLKNGAAIQWTAEKYTGAAQTIGQSVEGIQMRMANLIDEQKEKIGQAIATSYVGITRLTETINKIGDVVAVVVGVVVKLLVTNQMLVVDFYTLIVEGFKTVAKLVQTIWKDILHPEKWLKDGEDAFKDYFTKVGGMVKDLTDLWTAKAPVVEKVMTVVADNIANRWVAMGIALDQRANAFADRWVAMGRELGNGASSTARSIIKDWSVAMAQNQKAQAEWGDAWNRQIDAMSEKYSAYLKKGSDLTKGFSGEIGTALGAGTLSWKTFGGRRGSMLGRIISAIGDQLAAMAAADIVKALAAAASVFMAWAAPGYWAAAAIEGAGAAAAWATGAALNAIKLKEGGDFIVPPGYPNDSFPMRVESGEHVSVTPAGQGGDMTHIVVNLDGKPIIDTIQKASRNRKLLISARSVVA